MEKLAQQILWLTMDILFGFKKYKTQIFSWSILSSHYKAVQQKDPVSTSQI